MTKKNRGVTLVALVITIILLLIVSGITIAILNGNNGIINNAMKSKGETEYAEIKKEVIDEWYNVELKNVKGYKGLKDLEDELEDRLKEKDEDATVTYKDESETLEISFKGHTMDLTEKGKIIDNTEVTEVEKAEIEITKEPEDVTVYVGENATFETDAEGTGTLSYQWYKNNKNSSIGGTAIKNANQKTYTEVNAQKTEYNYFYCEVKSSSNGKTEKTKTRVAKLDIISTIAENSYKLSKEQITVLEHENINIAVTVDNDAGELTYQWYKNDENSNQGGTPLPGETGSIFDKNDANLDDKGYYYVVITQTLENGTTQTITTKPVKVDVKIPVSISSQSHDIEVLEGNLVDLSTSARGNGTVTYQWFKNNNNSNQGGTPIPGATQRELGENNTSSSSYSIEHVTTDDDAYYYCEVRQVFEPDGTDIVVKTEPVKITVIEKLEVSGKLDSQSVSEGQPATFDITVKGGGNVNIQWYKNNTNSTTGGTPIDGETQSNFTIPQTSAGEDGNSGDNGYYYCIVTQEYNGQINEITVGPAQLTVVKDITITNQLPNETKIIEKKAGVSYSIETNDHGEDLTYQWYFTENLEQQGTIIEGATNETYNISSENMTTNKTGYYYCVITREKNGLVSTATSNKAYLSVIEAVEIKTQPKSTTQLETHEAKLNVTINNVSSESEITYQWYKTNSQSNNDGTKITENTTATTNTFVIDHTQQGDNGYYWCEITQKYGDTTVTVKTDAVQIEVLEVTIAPSEENVILYVNGDNKEVTFSGSNMGETLSITDGSSSTLKEDNVAKITLNEVNKKIIIEPKAKGTTSVTIKESNAGKETTVNIEVKETSIKANDQNPLAITTSVGAQSQEITLTGINTENFSIETQPNSQIATATLNNNIITLTPVWAGETTIVVKESNGNQTVAINIVVNKATPQVILNEATGEIDFDSTKTFTAKPISIKPVSHPTNAVSGRWEITSSNTENIEITKVNNQEGLTNLTATDNTETAIEIHSKNVTENQTTITVKFIPTDINNYNEASATYTVTRVNKIQATAPVLEDTTFSYDGNPHTVGVISNGSGGTIRYRASVDGGMSYGAWQNDLPTITNISEANNGTLFVQAQILGDSNHTDSEIVTARCHIGNATINVTSSNYIGIYDGKPHGITVTVDNSINGAVVYYRDGIAVTENDLYDNGTLKSTQELKTAGITTESPTQIDAVESKTIYWCVIDLNKNYASLTGYNTITITSKDITNPDIQLELSKTSFTYTGSNQTPTITIKDGTETLTEGIDYILSYKNSNTNNDDRTNIGTITITVTGKGNYTGTNSSKTYSIEAKRIDDSSIRIDLSENRFEYNGTSQKPAITVTDTARGVVLSSGTDYTVVFPDNTTNPGTKTITILGTGNYTGTNTTKTYVIAQKTIEESWVSFSEDTFTYDGTEHTPTITVSNGSKTLTEGTDYNISFNNNTTSTDDRITAGTITVTIEGKGDYSGTITKTYVINKANATFSLSENTATKYTGEQVDLTTYIQNSKGNINYQFETNGTTTASTIDAGRVTLGAMSANDDNDQTVIVTITDAGNDNYEGTSKTFTITVKKYTRTLSWAATTPDTVAFGDTSKSATATVTGTGGTAGSISYSSSNVNYITVNSSTGAISVEAGGGSSVITATLARTTTVKQATIDRTITTTKAESTFDWATPNVSSTTAHPGETVDISSYVTGNKGTITYDITSNGTTTPSTITGSTITIGEMSTENDNDQTVTVTVTDPGNDNYEGKPLTFTITVQKYTRTLSWTETTPNSVTYLDTSKYATVSTSGTGGTAGEITYAVINGGDNLAINSGTGQLTPQAYTEGATVQATMVRTATVAETSITKSIAVARATGNVSLSAASGSIPYGTASATFSVTGSHGGTLSISDNNNTATCSLSSTTGTPTATIENLATIPAETTIIVTVTSAQTAQFNEASATYTLTIGQATGTMWLSVTTATRNPGETIDLSQYVQNAKGTVTYEITSNGTTTASTISGSTVTIGEMSTENDNDQTVVVRVTDPGDESYGESSAEFTITATKYTRTLSWTSGTPDSIAYGETGKSATVNVSGAGGTAGNVSYTSANTNYITINGSTGAISAVAGGGSSTITATMARTSTVKEATIEKTITTTKAEATMNLSVTTATKNPGETIDLSQYVQNAKGTVTYKITSNGTGTGPTYGTSSISGSTVTIGEMSANDDDDQTVVVTITDSGNGNYEGTSKTFTITAQKYTRTLTWAETTPDTVAYGDTSKSATVIINGTGGTAGSISYSSSNTNYITVNSSTGVLTVVAGGGSSDITASLARTTTVAATTTETAKTITTTKAEATFDWATPNVSSTTAHPGETVDISSYVTGNKGTITYEITSNGTGTEPTYGTSTISGSTVTIGEMSTENDNDQTVIVTVTDPGNSNYEGKPLTFTITVQKYTRTLSWTETTPNSVTYLDTSKYATVSTSGTGGTAGEITYAVTSGGDNLGINSTTGQLTPKAYTTGATVQASMARTSTVAETSITKSIAVARATGNISLSAASGSIPYGTASTTFSVTGSHGGTLSISDNNNTATCSLSSTTGTPTATIENLATIPAGTTIIITVKSAQTAQFNEASATYTLTIGQATGTMWLSVTTATRNPGETIDLSQYVQNAKGTVTYEITSNGTGTGPTYGTSSISGSTVTIGEMSTENDNDQTVVVKVTDSGDESYGESSTEFTITATKYTRTLSWTSGTPDSIAYGETGKSATVNVSGTGGTAGNVSYTSANTNYITINGSTGALTVVTGGGSSTITATMARTSTVKETTIDKTITTTKAEATMNLSVTTATKNPGETIDLSQYVQNAKGTVTYKITSNGTTTASTIDAGRVTIGEMSANNDNDQTVIVTITDSGNDNYEGTSKTFTITAQKYTRTLSWEATTPDTIAFGDTSKSATATVTGTGGTGGTAGSISYSSSNVNYITVDDKTGAISVVAAGGSSTITATLARTTTVKQVTIDRTINATKAESTFDWATPNVSSTTAHPGETVDIANYVTGNKGTIIYDITSNGTTTASTIDAGRVTIGAMSANDDNNQTVIVTVTDPGNDNYEGKPLTFTITVQKYTRTLSWTETTPNSVTYLDTSKYATVSTSGTGGTAGAITYSVTSGGEYLGINSTSGQLTPKAYTTGATVQATMRRTSTVAETSITKSIAVARATGNVSLSAASGNIQYGTASTTFSVTGSHGGTLSISDNNNTATCSLSSTTGTPTATIENLATIPAGTTIIVTVKSAQTAQFNEASATYTLTVGQATGTMTLSSNEATRRPGETIDLSQFVQNAQGTVTYEITSNGTGTEPTYGTSSISGSTVTIGAMSANDDNDQTVIVTITDTENGNYEDNPLTFTITATKYTRTLSWTSGTPDSVVYGETGKSATVNVSGTGGTAENVSYTSANTNYITINGSTGALTVVAGGGSSKITATMARTPTVKQATIDKTITTTKAEATMNLSATTATKNPGETIDLSQYVQNAKGTVTYDITSNGTGTGPTYGTSSIDIDGSIVTIGAMSANDDNDQTVVVTITDSGNGNYKGTSKTFTITAQKYTRTLTWADTTPDTVTFGDTSKSATVIVNGTIGTEERVIYASSNTNYIEIDNETGVISVKSAGGSSVITATLGRTATIKEATAQKTITTTKAESPIRLREPSATKNPGETIDISTYVENAQGNVTYAITSNGTTTASTINGSTVTIGAMSANDDNDQTVVVTITDSGNGNYEGKPLTFTITAQKYTRTLSWTGTTPNSVTYLDTSKYATVSTSGTGGTAGEITYAVTSGGDNLGINSTTGQLTPQAYTEGATVQATMRRTSTVAETSITKSIAVARAIGNVSLSAASGNIQYGTANTTFSVTGSHGGALSISDNNNTATSSLSSTTGTPTATIEDLATVPAGTTITVTVTCAQTEQFNEASATYTLTIGKAESPIRLRETSATKNPGETIDISTYVENAQGTVTYEITSNGTGTEPTYGTSTITGSTVTIGAMSANDDNDQTVVVTITDEIPPENTNYVGTPLTFTITAQKYTRTLSWTSGTPDSIAYGETGKSATVNVSGTGGTAGDVSYTSANTNYITINGSTGALTVVAGGGSSTITATMARTPTVKQATIDKTITTTKAESPMRLIETSATKNPGETIDISTYVENAQGTVTYEITSNGTGTEPTYGTSTITGSTVTIGEMSVNDDNDQTVIVTVTDQIDPGSENYKKYEGTSETFTITAQKYTRTLSWEATTPTSIEYGDTSKSATATATGTGGTAGNISYSSSNVNYITVNSSTGALTVVAGEGSSTITATMARTPTVKQATIGRTITTTKAESPIRLRETSATKNPGETIDISTYVENAQGTVTYEITSNGTGTGPTYGTTTITGSTVIIGEMSVNDDNDQTVIVTVTDQIDPGSENYKKYRGKSLTFTITAQKYTRTLSWTGTTPNSVTYLDTSKYATVSTSGTGGTAGTITYAVINGVDNLAINSGTGQLTPQAYTTGATVQATMARTETVAEASITKSIAVARTTGNISLSATSGSIPYGTASTTFSVTGNHGGTLSISDNNNTATCSLSSTTGTPTATIENLATVPAGTTITVTVTCAQTAQFNEASATYTLTIGKATGTMTLSSNEATRRPGETIDLSQFVQNAQGTVTYEITSNGTGTEPTYGTSSIRGSTITIGVMSANDDNDQTVIVTITDTENGNYEDNPLTFTITATKYTRTLSWTSGTPDSVVYGETGKSATVNVGGTGGTAEAITYSVTSGGEYLGINSTTGQLTPQAYTEGATVQATMARTETVAEASITKSIAVARATGNISLSATSGSIQYGTASATFSVTGSHGGTLSISDDNNTATCSLSSPTGTPTATIENLATVPAGTTIIVTVKSAQTAQFNEASATYTLTITKATGTMTLSNNEATRRPGETIDLSQYVQNAQGTVTYEITSNGTGTGPTYGTSSIDIDGKTVTIGAMSANDDNDQTVVVTITDPGNGNYEGTSKTFTITAQKHTITLSWTETTPDSVTYGDTSKYATVNTSGTGGTAGTITYAVINGVDNLGINSTTGQLTPQAYTEGATVQATMARTGTVAEASITKSIAVARATGNISLSAASGNIQYGTASTTFSITGNHGGTLSISDDNNTATCGLSSPTETRTPTGTIGNLAELPAGTTIIVTVTCAQTAQFNEASTTYTLNIIPADTNIIYTEPEPIVSGNNTTIPLSVEPAVNGSWKVQIGYNNIYDLGEGNSANLTCLCIGRYDIIFTVTFTPDNTNYTSSTVTITQELLEAFYEVGNSQAGLTFYNTLSSAYNGAVEREMSNIKVLKNAVDNSDVNITERDINLDLQSYTITRNEGTITVNNNRTLTINGEATSKITSNAQNTIKVINGVLNVNGGIIEGTGDNSSAIDVTTGTFNLGRTDDTLTNSNPLIISSNIGVTVNGSSDANWNFYNGGIQGNLSAYGEEYTNKRSSCKVCTETILNEDEYEVEYAYLKPIASLSASVSGTFVEGNTYTFPITYNGSGTLDAEINNTEIASVSIANGTLTIKALNSGTATITLSATEDATYAAPNDYNVNITVKNANYSISKGSPVYHDTLASAVNASQSASVITALANTSETTDVTIDKSITLDTDSYTLTRTKRIDVTAGTFKVMGQGTINVNGTDAGGINITGTSTSFTTAETPLIKASAVTLNFNASTGTINMTGGYLMSTGRTALRVGANVTGNVTLTDSYIYSPCCGHSAIYLIDGSSSRLTLAGSTKVGNGSSSEFGTDATSVNECLDFRSTGVLTLKDNAAVYAGPYSSHAIRITKSITANFIDYSSIFSTNTDFTGNGYYCVVANTVGGSTITFNSQGYFRASGAAVIGCGSYNNTIRMTAGHLTSRVRKQMVYNDGAWLSSPVGGDTTSNATFIYMNGYKSITKPSITECYNKNIGINTISVNVGDTESVTYSGGGSGTVTASMADTSIATATVSGTKITVKGIKAGSTTLTLTRSGGTTEKYTVKVNKITPTLTLSKSSVKVVAGNYDRSVAITYNGDGELSFSSSDSTVASAGTTLLSNNIEIAAKKEGTATITVNAAATNTYNAKSVKLTVTVQAALYDVIADDAVAGLFNSTERYHRTLKSAVTSADSGDTIKVLANTSEADSVTINKSLTINTNGKTLTRTGGTITVSAGTTTVSGTGSIKNTKAHGELDRAISVTGGTFKTTGTTLLKSNNNTLVAVGGALNLSGGYVWSTGGTCAVGCVGSGNATIDGVYVFNSCYNQNAIYMNADSTGNLTVKGASRIGHGETKQDSGGLSTADTSCIRHKGTGTINLQDTTRVMSSAKGRIAILMQGGGRLNCTGSSSVYSANNDSTIWFTSVSGGRVTFNSDGNFYAGGQWVTGSNSGITYTLTVTKGHFVSHIKYMFSKNVNENITNTGVSTGSAGTKNFSKMTAYNTVQSSVAISGSYYWETGL